MVPELNGTVVTPETLVADPTAQGVVAVLALAVNVVVLAFIIKKAKQLGVNPYTHEIWMGTKDYDEAMSIAEEQEAA